MAMRAVDRSERRISHPSESDLPSEERTWFRYVPPSAQAFARIRGMAVDSRLEVDGEGEPVVRNRMDFSMAGYGYLVECLTGIDNLVDKDGNPVEIPMTDIDGHQRVSHEALDLLSPQVQGWLGKQIQSDDRPTEEEVGEPSS